jgi:hypothetical protein
MLTTHVATSISFTDKVWSETILFSLNFYLQQNSRKFDFTSSFNVHSCCIVFCVNCARAKVSHFFTFKNGNRMYWVEKNLKISKLQDIKFSVLKKIVSTKKTLQQTSQHTITITAQKSAILIKSFLLWLLLPLCPTFLHIIFFPQEKFCDTI